MKNSSEIQEFVVESDTEKIQRENDIKYLEKSSQALEKKRKDISLLKKWSNVLISVMEIPSILLKLSEGHSVIITQNGHLFSGKINTEKLHDLGACIAGKNDGGFDINADVDSDISMLENQELKVGKQYVNVKKVLNNATRLFQNKGNAFAELFMDAWKFQAEKHPENVQIDHEISTMGHKYLLVKIKGLNYYGKVSEKSGALMYIVYYSDLKKEIPV